MLTESSGRHGSRALRTRSGLRLTVSCFQFEDAARRGCIVKHPSSRSEASASQSSVARRVKDSCRRERAGM